MNFNEHRDLANSHAFLSPSKYHWVGYDEEKLDYVYTKYQAAARGTDLHDFAQKAIRLRVRMPKSKSTLYAYINDGIGYRMQTEQTLFYSVNVFGKTDAISFRDRVLRIHDLKTGVTPASIVQLEIYEALFCLEYNEDPRDFTAFLRLYQNDLIMEHTPNPDDILAIMAKIVAFDKLINKRKEEG